MRLPPKALVGIPLLSILVLLVSSPVYGQQLTHTCKFDKGPRAGQTIAYLTAQPIPVGAPCSDRVASTGVTVPDNSNPQLTHTCKFDQGPRAGQVQVYPQSIPVGASCWDGVSSAGVTIADGTSAPEPSKPPPQNPAVVSPPEQKQPQPQATQPPPLKQDTSQPPSSSRPIQSSPEAGHFRKPEWMKALREGDLATLNQQRKNTLAYLYGMHLPMRYEPNQYDPACPGKTDFSTFKSIVTQYTGLDPDNKPWETIVNLVQGLDNMRVGTPNYAAEKQQWESQQLGSHVQDGIYDGKLFLKDSAGCSSPDFAKLYGTVERFVRNEEYRPGHGTLSFRGFRTRLPNAQDVKAGDPSRQKLLEDELQGSASQGHVLRICSYTGGDEPERFYYYWYPTVLDMSTDLRSALPSVLSAVLATCPAKEESFVVLIKIMTPKPDSSVTARIRPFAKDDIHVPPDPKYNMFGYRPDASEVYFGKLLDGLVNSGQQVLECADSSSRGRPQLFWYRTLPLVNNQVDPDFIDYATKWAANVAPGALSVCPAANPAEARYYLRLR